jgi:hypothetical protein
MPINIDTIINEVEYAVRNNLHNFDNMYQAVGAIFHRDLDGRTPTEQNNYIHWLMRNFGSKRLWFFSYPSAKRLKLMTAVALGKKYSNRSQSIAKLVEAGEAVLKMDIAMFKVVFRII